MEYSQIEILETIRMTEIEHLDIRTVTLGISLRDCGDRSNEALCERVRSKVVKYASRLVSITDQISAEYGIPIANRRIAVTPVSIVAESASEPDYTALAHALDAAAKAPAITTATMRA